MEKYKKIKKFILKYKVYIICIIIILLSIISVIIQDIERKNDVTINNTNIDKQDNKIGVFITGKVKNPGVYYLKENSRLYELLDICGGVTDDADISNLNLAKKLNDSDMITINEKKEENYNTSIIENVENEKGKININTATKEELKSLSGIGDQTANKIIEYRQEIKFIQVEDLLNVDGIGEAKFKNIKDDICV